MLLDPLQRKKQGKTSSDSNILYFIFVTRICSVFLLVLCTLFLSCRFQYLHKFLITLFVQLCQKPPLVLSWMLRIVMCRLRCLVKCFNIVAGCVIKFYSVTKYLTSLSAVISNRGRSGFNTRKNYILLNILLV